MRRRGIVTVAVFLAAFSLASAQDLGSEQQRQEGAELYAKFCSQCHGDDGDGQGHATPRVKPEPRDFTSGKYKFRTTPSGMLPTDADVVRVIQQGLPYTSMPAFSNLSDSQIQNIVYHLKTYSEDFQNPEKYGEPIDIPAPPSITDESIERGKVVYAEQGCAACHGNLGRGDGLSAPTLKDDWGNHIRPADMSQRWTFRGGPTREDMFRTFSTGLNGTPMPSYFDSLDVDDRWHLVNYMVSLGDGEGPNYSDLLLVDYIEDEIDLEAGRELFAEAPMSRFALVGQIIEPGRNFYPSATSIQAQAVYNRKEIAILLRWNDMRSETGGTNGPDLQVPMWDEDQPAASDSGDEDEGGFWGDEEVEDDGDIWGDAVVEEGEDDFWGEGEDAGGGTADTEFSDAVALQFPTALPSGIRKPYFIFGDSQNSVDLWFVDLAQPRVQQFVGRGSENLEPSEGDEFEVASGYDQGEWWVIIKRELRSPGNVTFQEGQFVPLAFSVWDGFNRERGNKRALSSWFYLYPEPMQEISSTGPVARAIGLTLLVEVLLVLWIRNRFSGPTARVEAAGGAVPQGGMAAPDK